MDSLFSRLGMEGHKRGRRYERSTEHFATVASLWPYYAVNYAANTGRTLDDGEQHRDGHPTLSEMPPSLHVQWAD
jgi:hypothetical protein